MKDFDVYFEIYGKKMKATVNAESMTEAKQKVIDEITFYKVVPRKKGDIDEIHDILGQIGDILGVKKK